MLELNHVSVGFKKGTSILKAVNKVNLSVKQGQIVGLVGESGCGKSTALFSMMGLIPYPGEIIEGEIIFQGRNIVQNTKSDWRKIRGKEIAMIFQDPMTALNPAYAVGEQIREMLKTHRIMRTPRMNLLSKKAERQQERVKVISLMEEVGIPSAQERYEDYPHQFSGGMQQRILVAMAIACNPKVLLADEPTTALDVTIQAQILALLKKINEEHGTSIILVTHDLGVASEFCDELAVMYAGQIVERGPTAEVIEQPKHPYTKGLLQSIPVISDEKRKIEPIKGTVIDLAEVGDVCGFYNRCPVASERCKHEIKMIKVNSRREVRCIHQEMTEPM